jgi:hypothetical protein
MFTAIGKELCRISGATANEQYFEKAWDYLESHGGGLTEETSSPGISQANA